MLTHREVFVRFENYLKSRLNKNKIKNYNYSEMSGYVDDIILSYVKQKPMDFEYITFLLYHYGAKLKEIIEFKYYEEENIESLFRECLHQILFYHIDKILINKDFYALLSRFNS